MAAPLTLLKLDPIGVPPYSARGIDQTLDPISLASDVDEDINGIAIDFSAPQFRKYKTEITCTDNEAPALSGVWPGQILTISCVQELGFLTATGSPERPVVDGSLRVSGDFTYYRPILVMRVTGYSAGRPEWAGTINWKLSATELQVPV